MGIGTRGRIEPLPRDPEWWEDPWPGMVLRTAEYDAQGNLVNVRVRRVPADRSLEDAMAWAARTYA